MLYEEFFTRRRMVDASNNKNKYGEKVIMKLKQKERETKSFK